MTDTEADLVPPGKPKESALADIVGLSHGWRARALAAERKLDARARWATIATLVALVEFVALGWNHARSTPSSSGSSPAAPSAEVTSAAR